MIKRCRKRKKRDPSGDSTRAKGDIVEQIVAAMHKTPGVTVETNVFLCSQDDDEDAREIDVLLSSEVAGYPVHVAIECKNEEKPTGVGEIDKFIGELKDVGIPTKLGIFVSASHYTKGAIRRAKKAGIRTLLLRDVTQELPNSAQEAFQSFLYLLLTITKIQVRNNIGGQASSGEILFFRDKDGKVCGSVPDLVWLKWKEDKVPQELGHHELNIELPDDWIQVVSGQVAVVQQIIVDVQITGHMITFPGLITKHSLINVSNEEIEKWRVEASFGRPSGTYPITTFLTEKDLENALRKPSALRLTLGRFPLPRIRWMAMYWPPSESAMKKLIGLIKESLENGKMLNIASLELTDIEGTDMTKLWEPIIEDHPLIKRHRND